MTSPSPVIHIIDDDGSFRTSMRRLLAALGYQTAIYESGSAFLENLPIDDAGCILLDLQMAGVGGFELQERLGLSDNTLPIIFLTAHGDIKASVQAMRSGAEDFLAKPVTKQALIECVERALIRNLERRQHRDRLRAMRTLVTSLTPREAEVFAMVVRGRLNKQIAHDLGTTIRTVKAHRQAGMDKLGVKSLAQAVSIAERLGMLTD